ncbi:MAG: helix-turn-helix transcriptional regulator [Rhodobacteraceae bacterium]|nr:helix-turn-helix transcriptional regulator [Paracoccaceae bacterium]MBR9820062.1 helix-turn-helix transcriptional regulator [Paracoccaceae bacterium]
MTYQHALTSRTEGIRPTAPVKWRVLDGLMGVFWQAEAHAGAQGYYRSADPRILFFFNDVAPHIRMTEREGTSPGAWRPMARAIYVPAGVPMWTQFTSPHRFSHVDLHLHEDRLLKFLSPALGTSAARAAIARPVELQETRAMEMLATLLVEEVTEPRKPGLYAESLVGSIVTGLLDLGEPEPERAEGRLTAAQMRRLQAAFDARGGRRLTVAEMAEAVGLSESWFAHVFKSTEGTTPMQWQLNRRIDLAKSLLAESPLSVAEIASRLGFSDQAHLTKVFRQVAGETPAAWRRARQATAG